MIPKLRSRWICRRRVLDDQPVPKDTTIKSTIRRAGGSQVTAPETFAGAIPTRF
jgi:hypothetical protein